MTLDRMMFNRTPFSAGTFNSSSPGGSSMFRGMGDRIRHELTSLLPHTVKVDITEWEDRNFMVWTGAAILSSLSAFAYQWISSQEYDEHGPTIVHRKCI